MANSRTDRADPRLAAATWAALPALAAGFALLCMGRSAPAAEPEVPCATGNLCFSASGPADYERDKVVLHDIVVYQGGSPMHVSATVAEASSLNFNDSNWVLTGAVEVRVAQGTLTADSARVHFLGSKLDTALATGTPATFASDTGVRGHASSIEYDLGAGEIRLRGDAWISRDGCNETRAALFVYNLAQRSVHAQGSETAGGSGRVQGTIRQCKPGSTPSTSPGAAPGAAPRATPGATPSATPGAAPGGTPALAPAATPGPAPAATATPSTGATT
jgi:lipopolysaccharide transport protein LptA